MKFRSSSDVGLNLAVCGSMAITSRGCRYRRFSLTWPASMQLFIETKISVCIRKEFNSHGIGLEHQYGGRHIM